MPSKTFLGAGVKTCVLFFTKGEPTENIWYYQVDPKRSLGKTDPLNDDDMAEFIALQYTKPTTEQSWTISVENVKSNGYKLFAKNPSKPDINSEIREPEEILDEISLIYNENVTLLQEIIELKNEHQ